MKCFDEATVELSGWARAGGYFCVPGLDDWCFNAFELVVVGYTEGIFDGMCAR